MNHGIVKVLHDEVITMKVIGYSTYGQADVLTEKDVDMPVVHAKDVLLKTMYTSVHPVDALARSGGLAGGQPLQQFIVPGTEVLGEVVEMGEDVHDFAVGDIVIGKGSRGGYAEYVKVREAKVFRKPKNMTDEAAASFSAVANTAYYSLFDFGQIQAGETIAILGASGGVGSIAIQIAKHEGLHVIAIASEKNKEYVLGLGADEFADYRQPEQLVALANRADIVVDASLFASSVDAGLAIVKDGGRYVTLTRSPQPPANKTVHIMDMRRTADMTDKKAMAYLTNVHEQQPFHVKPTAVFPFTAEGAKEAHTALEGGKLSKKILLKH